ncbi:MAG: hypothetical protein WC650_05550 [Candidatus Doudnabacteria bacterium]
MKEQKYKMRQFQNSTADFNVKGFSEINPALLAGVFKSAGKHKKTI